MLTGIVWEKEKSTVLDVLQIQKTSFLKTCLCQLFIAACTLLVVARGIQSSIRPGLEPRAPVLEEWSLSYRTPRKVPQKTLSQK